VLANLKTRPVPQLAGINWHLPGTLPLSVDAAEVEQP